MSIDKANNKNLIAVFEVSESMGVEMSGTFELERK